MTERTVLIALLTTFLIVFQIFDSTLPTTDQIALHTLWMAARPLWMSAWM